MSKLHSSTHSIPTYRPWWSVAWRFAKVRYLLWCLRCVVEEREVYMQSGMALGEAYIRNSRAQERDMRSRISMLQIHS